MGDKAFVVERWTVPIPEAPDGLAVIGWDAGRGTFLQHYFDERGVARVYEMSFADRVWKLERTKPDFSPFEFSQRFTGTLTGDGKRIDGTWEIAQTTRRGRRTSISSTRGSARNLRGPCRSARASIVASAEPQKGLLP